MVDGRNSGVIGRGLESVKHPRTVAAASEVYEHRPSSPAGKLNSLAVAGNG